MVKKNFKIFSCQKDQRGGIRGTGPMWLAVKPEMEHISVPHHILLAFHAIEALLARAGDGPAAHQVLVGNSFSFDEAALKVGVNDSGGVRGGFAGVDGPGA